MEAIYHICLDNAVAITGFLLILLIVGPYLWLYTRRTKKVLARQKEAEEFGLREPVTIHPKVNRDICIGSGACIKSCPEKEILGIVHGKAETVFASRCVGHGACARACPVGAIELVFGTEKRGVDIPQVSPSFETNVSQVFIAGELGGMGLIKNAILQGQEAVQYISKSFREKGYKRDDGIIDLLIIGAGPAGISASLQAMQEKLNAITIDQEDSFGGAVLSYPRKKLVMTRPAVIPLYGKVRKKEYLKEELLALWDEIAKQTSLKVDIGEKAVESRRENGFFTVKTTKREIRTRYILLCIGRRGTPRKLGVPGEQLPKVMYRLLEPEKYTNQNLLVVGGGDSAVEAAVALSGQNGTNVWLSYRKTAFPRIKPDNQKRVDDAVASGNLTMILESTVQEITEDAVILERKGETMKIPNDAVFIFVGGELPNAFLQKMGITIETKHGTR